jgi:uncharacterized protein YyaL (SSP411 family)
MFLDAHVKQREIGTHVEQENEMDVSAMRSHVDAIVKQVILQTQSGRIAPALKDDIMIVLRALRHRTVLAQQAATSDEAYLESATAMLHFCRLILQLDDYDLHDF